MNLMKEELLKLKEVQNICDAYYHWMKKYDGHDCTDEFRYFIESQLPKKEYEILSYTSPDGLYPLYGLEDSNPEYMLNHNFQIHSVKRLSDGEIFTVGDTVLWGIINTDFKVNIEAFHISKGKLYINHSKFYYNDMEFSECPNYRKIKKKVPLFLTEDGVEIFVDNKTIVYQVHVGFDTPTFTKVDEQKSFLGYYTENNHWKFFSTKEAAEEYILMNKPCLSINDIRDAIFPNKSSIYSDIMILIKLVKGKMKNG